MNINLIINEIDKLINIVLAQLIPCKIKDIFIYINNTDKRNR